MRRRNILTAALVLFSMSFCIGQNAVFDLVKFCRDNAGDRVDLRFRIIDDDCNEVMTTLYGERLPGLGYDSLDTFIGEDIFSKSINGSGSNQWSFYFLSIDSCNFDSSLSDTFQLDLSPPENVGIDSVSIIDNELVMGWSGSDAPDLKGYIIYLDDGSGLSQTFDSTKNEIDTLLGFNVVSDSLSYRLGAYDSCNVGTGPLDPHKPSILDILDFNPCEKLVRISRTNYLGWNEPKYDLVYRDTLSSTWNVLDNNLGQEEILNLDSLNREVLIKVVVTDTARGFTSSSNVLKLELQEDATIDTMKITSVKYSSEERLQLSWYVQSSGLVESFLIQRALNNSNSFSTIKTRKYDSDLRKYSESIDRIFDQSVFRIVTLSKCGDTLAISNIGTELRVNLVDEKSGLAWNVSLNKERFIDWNDYNLYEGGVEYSLIRRIGQNEEVLVKNLAVSEYLDNEDLKVNIDSGVCYKVIAYPISADSAVFDSSTSDIGCYFFNFHGVLPNAVVFDEDDDAFTIPVDGLNRDESEIRIFNRWGQLVFTGLEWNGGIDNNIQNPCGEGVYYYTGVISLKNRKVYYISSSLNVLR